MLRDYESAFKCHEQALEICRKIGDRRSEGEIIGRLGVIYQEQGDVQKAIEFYITLAL